ncbi:hypothetical protein Scep_006678 [Stephania cephalantha]|uniref:Uncharacterized protein n=1 Tax=Stephania cephalantha TaxID=152367 RepID=A0AAP0K8F0_9MAGN
MLEDRHVSVVGRVGESHKRTSEKWETVQTHLEADLRAVEASRSLLLWAYWPNRKSSQATKRRRQSEAIRACGRRPPTQRKKRAKRGLARGDTPRGRGATAATMQSTTTERRPHVKLPTTSGIRTTEDGGRPSFLALDGEMDRR